MRLMMKVTVVLAGLIFALIGAIQTAQTATPTPRVAPTAKPNATPMPSPQPETNAKPETSSTDPDTAKVEAAPKPFPTPPAGPSPVPQLYLKSQEFYTANGKNWVRHQYDVQNKAAYPAALFAPAPSLPPCGSNTNSSRTWVDFFDQGGKKLYGFCALTKPADLGEIWFSTEEGVIPPSWVYIEINDRQTNTKYKSNLAETTL